jgi:hypothetical protein
MEAWLLEAGMIETKMKQDLEYTCRALTQSRLHAPRGRDGGTVLHRPDQTTDRTPYKNCTQIMAETEGCRVTLFHAHAAACALPPLAEQRHLINPSPVQIIKAFAVGN